MLAYLVIHNTFFDAVLMEAITDMEYQLKQFHMGR